MPTKKPAGASTWVDPDDAPPLTEEFFARAEVREGTKLVRRGRPRLPDAKRQVTIRLDPELLDRLRATGPGWQTRLNEAVREWLKKHSA
ncbi:BrnA antitoxin family protein [Roseococcus microcysteis]|uniref:BrnA antitoxin family protein n=1 Tax=Roseococcus microcysteis TaxID=2771361 RepID=UPI00168BE01F|nr:BrnA antitoxin family protein [Roseococcus microcysteis]